MISKDWVFQWLFCLYVSKYVHRQTRVRSSFPRSSNPAVYSSFWEQRPNSQHRERVYILGLSRRNHLSWFCSRAGRSHTRAEREARCNTYTLSESCALANASGASAGSGSVTAYIQTPAAKRVSQNDPFAIFFTLNAFEDSRARFSCESTALALFAAWLSSGTSPPVTDWLVGCQRLLTTAWRGILKKLELCVCKCDLAVSIVSKNPPA